MMKATHTWLTTVLAAISLTTFAALERVEYGNPETVSDLGVGLWAWPLPMDWDSDGDMDLVVACPDVPFNGTYLFENPGGNAKMPVFKPPVRLGAALRNAQVCFIDDAPRVFVPGKEYVDFLGKGFNATRSINAPKVVVGNGKVRANQWKAVDFDGDGVLDLSFGAGYWGDYGWDNAFDSDGQWTRGPLHGWVHIIHNRGTNEKPDYEEATRLQAGGQEVDVYGMPSPSFADFDGDGDLDLVCGEFMDGFTYFRNTGTRENPVYAESQRLTHDGKPLAMNVQMITPTAVDWDKDGDIDLICGDEDGRVAFIENTGEIRNTVPAFLPPRFFKQETRHLKFGALVTPVSVDWDGDGDEDIIAGNTAGHIAFIENLDGGNPPKWAPPALLNAGGRELRIMAGPNGSIQGPCEAKWGYTTLSAADWDHDGLLDLVVNSIWGKVVWYRNEGQRGAPRLTAAQSLEVEWKSKPPKPAWNWWDPTGKELATQWRTTPVVVDWNKDGLNDLIMLDHEGYLAFFQRQRHNDKLVLLPGKRIFGGLSYNSRQGVKGKETGPLRLNADSAGRSGRRKLCMIDWDGDGRRDLLVNSINVNFMRNMGIRDGLVHFEDQGPVDSLRLAGHTTSPTTVNWDGDGKRDLLLGAEDGHFYYLKNTYEPPRPVVVGDLEVLMRNASMKRLGDGEQAYANRGYTWFDVPAEFKGWRYTQTSGGERARISVTPAKDGAVFIAAAGGQEKIDQTGWSKTQSSFGYTDKGRTRMQIYKRQVKACETLAIPQGNWSGGLLLLPPGNGREEDRRQP